MTLYTVSNKLLAQWQLEPDHTENRTQVVIYLIDMHDGKKKKKRRGVFHVNMLKVFCSEASSSSDPCPGVLLS